MEHNKQMILKNEKKVNETVPFMLKRGWDS